MRKKKRSWPNFRHYPGTCVEGLMEAISYLQAGIWIRNRITNHSNEASGLHVGLCQIISHSEVVLSKTSLTLRGRSQWRTRRKDYKNIFLIILALFWLPYTLNIIGPFFSSSGFALHQKSLHFLSPLNTVSHQDDCLYSVKSGLLGEVAGYKQLDGQDSISSRNTSFLFAAMIKLVVRTTQSPIQWAPG
jgi:hypothetical protein